MLRFIFITIALLMSLVQVSCKTNDKSSILVIAVDELISTDIPCGETDERSGFQLLCKESVRFTHAFTPSPLSAPALASILTGLYPYQHKLRHNGGPGLAAEFELASELALKNDYRTSFFSGGAPIFRRTGLQQGFETFEDNVHPNFGSLYRPLKKNIPLFNQWLKQEAGNSPFFSVMYVPDLLFTATPTTTDLGELRNLSFDSQLDELDESLLELFQMMKSQGRWDNTTVILVGLNGHTDNDRPGEVPPLNLHSENTQVALYIKPAQKKKRDEAIYWKLDQNVSLVDVGRTLFELLGESLVETPGDVQGHSLVSALKSPGTDIGTEDRVLLVESGWAPWRGAGPLRTAALSGHVLYINDQPPLLYNTLVDRLETTPLPLLQQSILRTTQKLQNVLHKGAFPEFPALSPEWMAKLSISFSRWMRPDQEGQLLKDLKRLSSNYPRSLDLANWTAQTALNQKDWETLKNIGIKNQNSVWQYVAERNLNIKRAKVEEPCFTLLTSEKVEAHLLKACSDPLFLEMIDWLRADARGLARDVQRAKFERSFRYYMLDQWIQRTNIAAGMIWDTSRENIYAPSRTELALHLPELTKARVQVYKSLSGPEPEFQP